MKKTPSIDETVVSAEINGKIVWENLFKDVKNYIKRHKNISKDRQIKKIHLYILYIIYI